MISESERIKYVKRYGGNLDSQQRQALFKQIVTQCKKVRTCPHCEAYNGTIKKMPNIAVRINHSKYSDNKADLAQFIEEFKYSCSVNSSLE